MKVYLVTLEDFEGIPTQCICETERDLLALINIHDKRTYEIMNIKKIGNWIKDYTELTVKTPGLETGVGKTGIGTATVA